MSRTQGAFDHGRCVATFRSFDQELTVPGGGRVPANAITNVTTRWWELNTGRLILPSQPWKEPYHVVCQFVEGPTEGLLAHTAHETWQAKLPDGEATVRSLIDTTPSGL
ncbi:hypothetical protein ADK55_31655 [Streptomyces sp. WM4235]|uniref:GNAT family N-acetyltransferase n=1 Tax=Streptomyces sp. WM4235 TaxID=1415551 RepID=UPI0006AE77D3|nr:hypothetical protein ADK55_31655 [Streptomyces sp. WM4235]